MQADQGKDDRTTDETVAKILWTAPVLHDLGDIRTTTAGSFTGGTDDAFNCCGNNENSVRCDNNASGCTPAR